MTGDWLKMVNGENVTSKTLDQILLNITPPTTVMHYKYNNIYML